jgi:hypothetical protein
VIDVKPGYISILVRPDVFAFASPLLNEINELRDWDVVTAFGLCCAACFSNKKRMAQLLWESGHFSTQYGIMP